MVGSAMQGGYWQCVEPRLPGKSAQLLGDHPASELEVRWADQIGDWMHLFTVKEGRIQGVKEPCPPSSEQPPCLVTRQPPSFPSGSFLIADLCVTLKVSTMGVSPV